MSEALVAVRVVAVKFVALKLVVVALVPVAKEKSRLTKREVEEAKIPACAHSGVVVADTVTA